MAGTAFIKTRRDEQIAALEEKFKQQLEQRQTLLTNRLAELAAKNMPATLESVMEDIEIRDHRDKTRDVGPLVQPHDAVVIETDALTPEAVLDRLEEEVKKCARG